MNIAWKESMINECFKSSIETRDCRLQFSPMVSHNRVIDYYP